MFNSQPRSRISGKTVFATAVVVLFLALGLVATGAVLAFGVLDNLRQIERTRGQWALAQKESVVHLERLSRTADPLDFQRHEEALALPRAVRPPLRIALDSAGNIGALERALADGTNGLFAPGPWLQMARTVGTNARTIRILERWSEADQVLLELEVEGARLAQALWADGAESSAVEEILQRIEELDQASSVNRRAFENAYTEFSDSITSRIRSAFVFSGVFIFILAAGVLRLVWVRLRHTEGALVESEARFRQLAEGIREVFWLTSPDKGKMLYLSPAYEEIWGRPVEESMKESHAWLDAIHPEDRPRVEAWLPTQLRERGSRSYRIIRPDGEVRWIRDRSFPVLGDDGKLVSVAGIATDVTRERALEAQAMEGRAFRSTGRLAAGVAHEFNNLLTSVQAYLQFAMESDALPPEVRTDLEAALAGSRRGGELTRRLLALGGRQILTPGRHEVAGLLTEAKATFQALLPETIQLSIEVAPSLPPVEVDPASIREALTHLLENAREAMPNGGQITVRAYTCDGAAHDTPSSGQITIEGGLLPPEARAGLVVLEVADSGPGLPRDVLDDLFVPFGSNLKEDGQLSLGLPTVHGIMRQAGGGVSLVTGPKGTTVRLFLPPWPEDN